MTQPVEHAHASGEPTVYARYGSRRAPCVLVLGGISAGPNLSWWKAMVGPGKALDPKRFQLLTVAPALGSIADQAARVHALLQSLEIVRLHGAIGCSYGGMVVLELANRGMDIQRLVLVAAAHRSHAMATARRLVQRRILEFGRRLGAAEEGVALARTLAMTTYRGEQGLDRRFDSDSLTSWLDYHGRKFSESTDSSWFENLLEAVDEHDVRPESIATSTLVVGFESDQLVPPWLSRECATRLPMGRCCILPSLHGHDAFILETDALNPVLLEALSARSPL